MSNPKESSADNRLWCLHHIGPDEVHPAPDFATAQGWADYANQAFAAHADISRIVVAVWPWSAEGHAEGLKAAIADWTVPEEGNQSAREAADLLTRAIADITSALIMAGKEDKVADWTAPYVETVNRLDATAATTDQAKLIGELAEALEALIPTNLAVGNCNIADDATVPLDIPMGELRKARAAIAKATGEAGQ